MTSIGGWGGEHAEQPQQVQTWGGRVVPAVTQNASVQPKQGFKFGPREVPAVTPQASAVAALRDQHNAAIIARNTARQQMALAESSGVLDAEHYQEGYADAMNAVAELIRRYAKSMYDAVIEE